MLRLVANGGLTWPLKQKWFWMLFLALLGMLLGAFVVVFVIVSLSPSSLFLMFIVVLVVWFVVRSYRKWSASKSDEEGEGQEQQGAKIFLTGLTRRLQFSRCARSTCNA